jgi:hypothetical protein
MYEGTFNAREICNWVALHARFMDAVKKLTFDEIDEKFGSIARTNWRAVCSLIDDTDLLDYWRRNASRHSNDKIACWDESEDSEEPEYEPERLSGTPDCFVIHDRDISNGVVNLDDWTDNGRYPTRYDMARQAIIIELREPEPERPVTVDPEPIDDDWDETCQDYH